MMDPEDSQGARAGTPDLAASTATGHLNVLVAGGLLAEERQGRHRYVRLADAGTAELIENLASMAPRRAAQPAR